RVIGVTALGAAAIGATLGLFFAANARLKSANAVNARATAVNAAAYELRAHVTDLRDALDAVIANYKPANVARWHRVEQTWRGPAGVSQSPSLRSSSAGSASGSPTSSRSRCDAPSTPRHRWPPGTSTFASTSAGGTSSARSAAHSTR